MWGTRLEKETVEEYVWEISREEGVKGNGRSLELEEQE